MLDYGGLPRRRRYSEKQRGGAFYGAVRCGHVSPKAKHEKQIIIVGAGDGSVEPQFFFFYYEGGGSIVFGAKNCAFSFHCLYDKKK